MKMKISGICTCGRTSPENAKFEDEGPFPDDYFKTDEGEEWYHVQANVYRKYVLAREKEQKKYLKQAKETFVQEYQIEQIQTITKHYMDMHNISKQVTEKKQRIFNEMKKVEKKLMKKARKESMGSVMNACRLSISKLMVNYSSKYPRFLEAIENEISEWKAFMLEKHSIYFDEHEEKVQAYYDALEREKNEDMALAEAQNEANKNKEQAAPPTNA